MEGRTSRSNRFWQHHWRINRAFVNASLVQSSDILRRASPWSNHTQREGLLTIKFDLGWRNHMCIVERWYQTQKQRSQEQCSTTHFASIQHRRTCNAPFFHEFLLIPLADGSLYRLERTGVGSDKEAISPSGCTALDLIEWFPKDKYNSFIHDKPCELITEVSFPCEFDVIDILAVCYSIQQNKKAARYSLQRYNCYFFCCVILSVLGRRVGAWENTITTDLWMPLLQQALDRISHLSKSPPQPTAQSYAILRICSILDPDNPHPAQFLIDGLRIALGPNTNADEDFNLALSDSLWRSDWHSSIRKRIEGHVKTAASLISGYNGPCATIINSVHSSFSKDITPQPGNELVRSIFGQERATVKITDNCDIPQQMVPYLQSKYQLTRTQRLGTSLFMHFIGAGMGVLALLVFRNAIKKEAPGMLSRNASQSPNDMVET